MSPRQVTQERPGGGFTLGGLRRLKEKIDRGGDMGHNGWFWSQKRPPRKPGEKVKKALVRNPITPFKLIARTVGPISGESMMGTWR